MKWPDCSQSANGTAQELAATTEEAARPVQGVAVGCYSVSYWEQKGKNVKIKNHPNQRLVKSPQLLAGKHHAWWQAEAAGRLLAPPAAQISPGCLGRAASLRSEAKLWGNSCDSVTFPPCQTTRHLSLVSNFMHSLLRFSILPELTRNL